MEGFPEMVAKAWGGEVHSHDPLRQLHMKLECTTLFLKRWHRRAFDNLRLQLAITRVAIGTLHIAQESRDLSTPEKGLCISLCKKILGIVSITKSAFGKGLGCP